MRERSRRFWKALTTAVAAAGVLAASGRGDGFASSLSAFAGPVRVARQGGDTARTNRPFEHTRHERVSCLECHGTGDRHATYLVRSARDCAGCHHDAQRGIACTTCHDRGGLRSPAPVTAAMVLAGRGPATRRLSFQHGPHVGGEAPVPCGDCHRAPVTLARERECNTCHAQHHRTASNCITCHETAAPGVHTREVHLSCAGSGCHAASAVPSPAESRTVCLACHRTQVDHEPGGSCARCHRIPRSGPAGRGLGEPRP